MKSFRPSHSLRMRTGRTRDLDINIVNSILSRLPQRLSQMMRTKYIQNSLQCTLETNKAQDNLRVKAHSKHQLGKERISFTCSILCLCCRDGGMDKIWNSYPRNLLLPRPGIRAYPLFLMATIQVFVVKLSMISAHQDRNAISQAKAGRTWAIHLDHGICPQEKVLSRTNPEREVTIL